MKIWTESHLACFFVCKNGQKMDCPVHLLGVWRGAARTSLQMEFPCWLQVYQDCSCLAKWSFGKTEIFSWK